MISIENIEEDAKEFCEDIKKIFNNNPYIVKRVCREDSRSNIDLYRAMPKYVHKMTYNNDQSFTYKLVLTTFSNNSLFCSNDKSFGVACKEYQKNSSRSFEKRFLRLIEMDSRESIYEDRSLMHISKLLNKNQIYVDYVKLFVDLWFWGDNVKDRWARDFFAI